MRMMRHDPNERVTQELGIEICKRQGLKAVVVPEIAAFGNTYLITLEAIDARNQKLIARQAGGSGKQGQGDRRAGQSRLAVAKTIGREPELSGEVRCPTGSCDHEFTRSVTSLPGGADAVSFWKTA